MAGFPFLRGEGVEDGKYTKPALTSEQQADQLLSRGLVADRDLTHHPPARSQLLPFERVLVPLSPA